MSNLNNEYDALSAAYRDRYGRDCAFVTWTTGQVVAYTGALVAGWLTFMGWPYETWVTFSYCLSVFIFAALTLRLLAVGLTVTGDPTIEVGPDEYVAVPDAALPAYSVLVPLYREPEVVPELLKALGELDYPRDKLDVQLLLEPDDDSTRAALAAAGLPEWIRVTLSPGGQPRTKPRACNVGLELCRGEYIVIFDAEDRPEPDQLRKVVAAYRGLPESVVCLQARLAHYNSRQGIFAMWSAMEYLLWYRLTLPGLQRLGAPIPLGGTSNHFRASALRALGGWDPFNVTEDCDLGVRIARRGWETRMIASTTWEEAVTSAGGWIRQRSRWVKGYWQTWLVHSRSGSLRDLGLWRWSLMMLLVGGNTAMLLVNPLLWCVILAWLVVGWPLVEVASPASVGALVLTLAMLAMNVVFVGAAMLGCVVGRRGDLVPAALASPVEWILLSAAAWKGWLQFFGRPFFWEKTHHGVFETDSGRGHMSVRAVVAGSFVALVIGSVGMAVFVQARISRDVARQGVVKATQLPSDFGADEWAAELKIADFSAGVEGWVTAPQGRVGWAADPSGSWSNMALCATATFPGEQEFWVDPKTNWSGFRAVAVNCFVPAGAPEGLRVMLVLKDRGRYWYQHESGQRLMPGKWTRIEADLRPAARKWRPAGHRKSWDEYTTQYVRTFGVKVHAPVAYSGPVMLDDLRAIPCGAGESPSERPVAFAWRGTVPDSAAQYGRFEASFDLGKAFDNPFDPDVVDVTGVFTDPDGKCVRMPAFFYQEFERSLAGPGERVAAIGRGYWRVRFTPVGPGRHSVEITVSEPGREKATGPAHGFDVAASDMPGFVRRSEKKPQFLVRDNGDSFYMVGHNICWPVELEPPCKYEFAAPVDQGTFTYERWLERMAENGENWGRIWISPWNLGIEAPADWTGFDGIGRYGLANAWRLDRVIEKAAEKGIVLTLTMQHKTDFQGSWIHHPYMRRNGGPLDSPMEYFRNLTAVRAMEKRLRYVVARWGYSPNILAWELWGEVNLVPGFTTNDVSVVNWHRDMAMYLRGIDPWQHMVFTHCHNWQNGHALWALPWVDCVQGNGYIRPPNRTPNHVQNFRNYIAEVESYAKPVFVAEYGGRSELGAPSPDYLEAQLHSGLWASVMHPFAGTAKAWWWNFIDGKDLYWHYKGIAGFVGDVDRLKHDFVTVYPAVAPADGALAAVGMRADSMIVAWVHHRDVFTKWTGIPEVKGAELSIEGVKPGVWRVEYWDTCAAKVVGEEKAVCGAGGTVRLSLPLVRRDLGVKMRRSAADAH